MIGVIASDKESAVVHEFFQLFKTPWEWYDRRRRYDVLIGAGDGILAEHAKLVVIYGGSRLQCDAGRRVEKAEPRIAGRALSYSGAQIPIYGDVATFQAGSSMLVDDESRQPAMCLDRSGSQLVVRIGYSLFGEVRRLLTAGQPVVNAGAPTLELHISLLRDLILSSGIRLVEIPPLPNGYRFLACLTHDIDHPDIRRHKFDHTIFGFLYRCTLGSLLLLLQGRLTARDLMSNWKAAVKLPLVYLGLAKDFWSEFDRYSQLENGFRSTFFVIPFKNRPGRTREAEAPRSRAAKYGAADISGRIRRLISAGNEVGTHGIDAWYDSSSGRDELEEVRRITGKSGIGVRMHWLYYDEHSPELLEKAGADYDSTCGYNETIGYRAGTTQAYKPLQVARLTELPLHVMDTALFFPSYMDLSPNEARKRVGKIIDNAVRLGGCITVNWHDRSIAPERLWGDFYQDLVNELRDKGAWFATAAQAVSWFRKRRSAVFGDARMEADGVRVDVTIDANGNVPDLQLRFYDGQGAQKNMALRPDAAANPRQRGDRHLINSWISLQQKALESTADGKGSQPA